MTVPERIEAALALLDPSPANPRAWDSAPAQLPAEPEACAAKIKKAVQHLKAALAAMQQN